MATLLTMWIGEELGRHREQPELCVVSGMLRSSVAQTTAQHCWNHHAQMQYVKEIVLPPTAAHLLLVYALSAIEACNGLLHTACLSMSFYWVQDQASRLLLPLTLHPPL